MQPPREIEIKKKNPCRHEDIKILSDLPFSRNRLAHWNFEKLNKNLGSPRRSYKKKEED
jgi:hypothetical protein